MKPTTHVESATKRFVSKGVFPHQMAFTLLIPFRNIFLSPKQLMKRLELKEDFQVLEVGPGPGYFSLKVAGFLKKGKIFLADIQQEMLDFAKKRAVKKGLKNIEYHLCNGKTFPFDNNFFDRIFMVTVIGEVENREDYLKEMYRILKPGGILSISELAGDPDKLKVDEVKNLCTQFRFSFYKLHGSEKNYTLNFKK